MTFIAHAHAGVGGATDTRIALAVLVLHVVAAAVWIGGVLLLAARRVTVRRIAPMTGVAALATIASGAVNARIHIEAPALLTHRAYGWVFLTKLALVGLALVLARRIRRVGQPRIARIEAVALTLAAVGGVALSMLPGLTSTLPGVSVIAAPTNDPECLSEIQGAFAAVHDQRPTSTLTFAAPSDAVPAGAVRVAGCTPAGTSAGTATLLRSVLHRQHEGHVQVVVDDDPRGAQLAAALDATAVHIHDLSFVPTGAVVVATSWTNAAASLRAVESPTRTVLLAPWLLRRTLLAPSGADTSVGQIAVATALDPTGPTGVGYVAALAKLDGNLEPTAAGLRGYRQMRGTLGLEVGPADRPSILTPVDIAFLPPALEAGHSHSATSGWLPIGDLTQIA